MSRHRPPGYSPGGLSWSTVVFPPTYDRNTSFGRLDKALDAAAANGWIVVDMRNDWKRIFAFE